MQKLPIKSTDRKTPNDNTKNDNSNIPFENNKTKITILRIILIILIIIIGTAICTTVIYFVFLNKDANKDEINNSYIVDSTGKVIKAKKQTGTSQCTTGTEEFCKTCDDEKNECSSCNSGYYLPLDADDKSKCKKCKDIVTNCNECHGELNSVTCDNFIGQEAAQTTCNLNFEEKKEFCKDVCEGKPKTCEIGYELIDGECKLMYTYRATILTTKPYEKVNLIYSFRQYIKRAIIDGVLIEKPNYAYNFTEPKVHVVYVLLDIPPKLTDYSNTFYGCENFLSIHFTPLFNTTNTVKMISFFSLCYNLTSINLSVFDTRNVESMIGMFSHCEKLTSIDITNFNTSKVIDMSDMFDHCYSLTSIDLSKLKSPKLSLASAMFSNCVSLTSIDISYIQSKKLSNIGEMFHNCINLKYINVLNVNTSRVVHMSKMFRNCTSLSSIDLSSFDTSLVRYMANMFDNCISLTSIDIGQFKTDNVYSLASLFKGCTSLTYINMASAKYQYNSDIYQLVPNGGTIIVHPLRVNLAEKYLSPKGWNIIAATENN